MLARRLLSYRVSLVVLAPGVAAEEERAVAEGHGLHRLAGFGIVEVAKRKATCKECKVDILKGRARIEYIKNPKLPWARFLLCNNCACAFAEKQDELDGLVAQLDLFKGRNNEVVDEFCNSVLKSIANQKKHRVITSTCARAQILMAALLCAHARRRRP